MKLSVLWFQKPLNFLKVSKLLLKVEEKFLNALIVLILITKIALDDFQKLHLYSIYFFKERFKV